MAVAFEHYGQTVAATAPSQAAYVPPQAQAKAQTAGQAGDWLMTASVRLLIFAGTLVVVGQLLSATPLGKVTADDAGGLGFGVIVAGMVVAGLVTLASVAVTRGHAGKQ